MRKITQMPAPQELWQIREASKQLAWQPFLHKSIQSVSLVWQKVTGYRVLRAFGLNLTLPFGKTRKYPQTVVLTVNDKPLILTVGEPAHELGKFHGFSDHLLVFFDSAKAKEIGFLDSE